MCGAAHSPALLNAGNSFPTEHMESIIDHATRSHLPTLFENRGDVGAVMSCGPHIANTHRRTAGYLDRILRDANPQTDRSSCQRASS